MCKRGCVDLASDPPPLRLRKAQQPIWGLWVESTWVKATPKLSGVVLHSAAALYTMIPHTLVKIRRLDPQDECNDQHFSAQYWWCKYIDQGQLMILVDVNLAAGNITLPKSNFVILADSALVYYCIFGGQHLHAPDCVKWHIAMST